MGYDTFTPPTRNYFGVIVIKPSISLLKAFRGQLLSSCSATQFTVERFSSFKDSSPEILKISLLINFTNETHAPPKCAGFENPLFSLFVRNCAAFQNGSVF